MTAAADRVSAGLCQAAVPVNQISSLTGQMLGDAPVIREMTIAHAWAECGKPAVAQYAYLCEAGHVKFGLTCAEREPAEGQVGCRECWDAGTERPMAFTRADNGGVPGTEG